MAHPIGYLLVRTIAGIREPWMRAKFAADAPMVIDKAMKQHEIAITIDRQREEALELEKQVSQKREQHFKYFEMISWDAE